MSETKIPFCGIHDILFKIFVLGNLYDSFSKKIEFSMCLESLNYHKDRFAKIKTTDELFMNQYLEKGFCFSLYSYCFN